MAALTADELIAVKQKLVPILVGAMRRNRAGGVSDVVADTKARYQTSTPVGKQQLMVEMGFGADVSAVTLDPGDFNECVNMAALQL
jgi:hypothetical protein